MEFRVFLFWKTQKTTLDDEQPDDRFLHLAYQLSIASRNAIELLFTPLL